MSDDLNPTPFEAIPASYEIQFHGHDDILAEWNAATDVVTFNWPKIEEVATTNRAPLQGLAKILIAARAAPASV